MKDTLKYKKKQKDLDFGNVHEKKIQGQNRSAMGPLLKIWTAVKSARLSQEDSMENVLKEIQELVEQTALQLGQASNSFSYYRRLNMLLALANSSHLQIKKANLGDVIKYIAIKKEILSPRSSPDTDKEFRRAITTKASSKERNNVTVFEKVIQ